MSDDEPKKCLFKAAEIAEMAEVRIRHPLNPRSEVQLRPLSELSGMARVRLTLARIPPGKESFAYHAHEADEEFVYILSGRGRAEIGEETVEVGPGDFMGFAVPSIAHHLTNPYDEDLVYLMGGERSRVEIGTFPRAGKRIIFSASGIWQVDEKDLKPMGLEQWFADDPEDGND
ncbi:MAG: cupin domain-containing protein [Geminicoccaceae bacterium]